MKPNFETTLASRLGRGWDFSRWFALLSPLIGAALGLFGVFLLYR